MAHLIEKKNRSLFNALIQKSKQKVSQDGAPELPSNAIDHLRPLLHFFTQGTFSDSLQDASQASHLSKEEMGSLKFNFEKLNFLLKEKDKRIEQLLQYEYSAKKALQQKTWQQELLEKEKLRVKILEKENEIQQSTLAESRLHAEQLERAVQFLQKRVEEDVLEKDLLQGDHLESQEAIARILSENEQMIHQRKELEKNLAEAVEMREYLDQEMTALYKQFDVLKKAFEAEKKKVQFQNTATEQALGSLNVVQNEKEQLKNILSAWKEEISIIKQQLKRGLREAKELENKYSEAVAEKILTLKTLHQLQREFEKQCRDNFEIKEKFKANVEREKIDQESFEEKLKQLTYQCCVLEEKLHSQAVEKRVLTDQLELLIIKNDLLKEEQEAFTDSKIALEKEKEIVESQHKQVLDRLENVMHANVSLESQNELLQQEVEAHQALCEERQIHLDEAQQHLAKKVREAALLNEKVDELILQLSESDCVYKALQQANSLIQGDMHKMELEKNELLETIQLFEQEIKKEEAKWKAVDKRRQLAEEKVVALEKIEQRHAQLQNLLSGFGNVLGNPIKDEVQEHSLKLQPPTLQFGDSLPEEPSNQEIEGDSSGKAYPNLFDIPQGTFNRPKKTLFD